MKSEVKEELINILHTVGASSKNVTTIGADVYLEINAPKMLGELARGLGKGSFSFTVTYKQALAIVCIPFGAKISK
jgi:hypothetical protein